MNVIGGGAIPRNRMPAIYVGNNTPLAYVQSAKSGCTLAKHILFYLNHGYYYSGYPSIHESTYSFWSIMHPPTGHHQGALEKFNQLDAKLFTFVRDPIERFLSSFMDKIWRTSGSDMNWLRDSVTCNHGVNLSSSADLEESCLQFVRYMMEDISPLNIDHHFRPQFLNLSQDVNFPIDAILRIEDQNSCIAFLSEYVDREKAIELLSKKINASGRDPNLGKLLSPKLIGQLEEYYKDDFSAFY